jgi:hypothetical protein
VSSRGALPNFPLAFLIAPCGGALGAGILATALAAPYRFGIGPWRYQLGVESLSNRLWGTLAIGMLTALGAYGVAATCTVIMGAIAVTRHTRSGKAPSLAVVLTCGSVAGVLPVACFPLLLGVPTEFTGYDGPGAGWAVAFFISIAATTSFITSWTFWRLGLKGRT